MLVLFPSPPEARRTAQRSTPVLLEKRVTTGTLVPTIQWPGWAYNCWKSVDAARHAQAIVSFVHESAEAPEGVLVDGCEGASTVKGTQEGYGDEGGTRVGH